MGQVLRVYPPSEALARPSESGRSEQRHESAADFMRALRAIGAGTPREGHHPIPPGAMRRIARRFEASGAVAAYEVALIEVAAP